MYAAYCPLQVRLATVVDLMQQLDNVRYMPLTLWLPRLEHVGADVALHAYYHDDAQV